MEPMIFWMLDKHSANWITSPAPNDDFLTSVLIQSNSFASWHKFPKYHEAFPKLKHANKSMCILSCTQGFMSFYPLPNFGEYKQSFNIHVSWGSIIGSENLLPQTLTHFFTLLKIGLCGKGDSLGISSRMSYPQWYRNLGLNLKACKNKG